MDDSVLSAPVRQVGPYMLTHRLGVGGMGEVWAGRRTHDTGAYKTVAVKILPAERAHDDASRRMFDDEARLSMLLCNSNIVQVFDVGESLDICYMAMEWVDGLNLDEFAKIARERGQPLPLSVVGYIIGEILKALAYAHDFEHEGQQRTVVHRDVSAHNVMISVAGEVKLMDFGIARVASEATSGLHIKGKLRYMPPEQLRGDTREPTVDLFAVGAILHELLDNRRFRSGVVDEARLYGMVLDGEIPALECQADRVPPALEALRSGLLEAKVADRIQSARQAHRCLSAWAGYRDARFELQDLVREYIRSKKPLAPTTSTFELVRTNQLTQPAAQVQNTSTDDRMNHSLTVREPVQPAALAEERNSSASVVPTAAIVGASLAGLATGMVGLFLLANEGHLSPKGLLNSFESIADAQVAAATPAVDDPVDPGPMADAEPEQTVEAGEIPEPPQEPPQDVREAAIAVPAPERPPPKTSSRVSAKVIAPQAFWLEVEIAGKSQSIDRMRGKTEVTFRLRPGKHKVRYRSEASGSWKLAGTITIPDTGESVVLELDKSGKISVE